HFEVPLGPEAALDQRWGSGDAGAEEDRSLPTGARLVTLPEERQPVPYAGDRLQVPHASASAEVALDQRYRVDRAHLGGEWERSMPGQVRVVVVPPVVRQPACC